MSHACERAIESDFGKDVLAGFAKRPRGLSSRFFYDDAGSNIYREIQQLPEYYVYRQEMEALRRHAEAIAAHVAYEPTLFDAVVELGCGDASKSTVVLDALTRRLHRFGYIGIDISGGALEAAKANIAALGHGSRIGFIGEESEFEAGIARVAKIRMRGDHHLLVMFLGSNIGNYSTPKALELLRELKSTLRPGDMFLCGFSMRTDPKVMQLAYDDPSGVTARFNLNLLERINRELGGDFNINLWRHYAHYDIANSMMVSHLVALEPQAVRIAKLGRSYDFEDGEAIYTECSRKYTFDDIEMLAAESGFQVDAHFVDNDNRPLACDSLWRVG